MIKRVLILSFAAAVAGVLLACGTASQHTEAITAAIVGYSDYYIEVHNLSEQVKQGYQSIDPKQSAVAYTIEVSIPDYTADEFRSIAYTLPAPDLSAKSSAAYQKKAVLAIRQSLETYALNHTASRFIDLPVTFDLVTSGNGWAASMSSNSKLEIKRTVESMMAALLEDNDSYLQNYRLALVSDELNTLLADALGGQDYADLVQITTIVPSADNTFVASLSYPDPVSVYKALGDAYAASFNQSFYGDPLVVSLTADGLDTLDVSGAPLVSDDVTVSFDPATDTCELTSAVSLLNRVSAAKQQADEDVSAEVNASWRIAPLAPPSSGAVLEGESTGNQIVFNTGAQLGAYYYIRFYAISGEDASEEGALTAGMFIVGGQSAKIRLPSGFYRVACYVGDDWYGVDDLFGKSGKVYGSKNAISSKDGYINTVSFG